MTLTEKRKIKLVLFYTSNFKEKEPYSEKNKETTVRHMFCFLMWTGVSRYLQVDGTGSKNV